MTSPNTEGATAPNADQLVLRLQHMYTLGEDPTASVPQTVDVAALLSPVRKVAAVHEMTLDGMKNVSSLSNRNRYPTADTEQVQQQQQRQQRQQRQQQQENGIQTSTQILVATVQPKELRTFQLV
jgi:hypothetical protein